MVAFAWPAWLDPELLGWIILVALAVLLYAMYIVVRFVRRLVTKVVLFGALAAFGLSLWIQRDDLQNCARTCACSLYGQEVAIPYDQLPAELRLRLPDGTITCRPVADGVA